MDQYVYSNKGYAPAVFHDQEWVEHETEGVRTWTSPDGVWVKVQQTMQWEGFRGVWPIAQQKMDRLARGLVEGARLHGDTMNGVTAHAVWTRTYRTI